MGPTDDNSQPLASVEVRRPHGKKSTETLPETCYDQNALEMTWCLTEARGRSVRTALYDQFVSSIEDFVESLLKDIELNGVGANDEPLHTLVAVLNSNLTDRDDLFSRLCNDSLYDDVLFVRLTSFDCPSSKVAVQRVVQGLCRSGVERGLAEVELKTFRDLEVWYTETNYDRNRRIKKKLPLLMVIVEDVDLFRSQVLQDIVSVCHCHKTVLPFVFLFGLSTGITAVHKLLPYSITSLLSIKLFCAPKPSDYLNALVEELFLSEVQSLPFKLGSDALEFLCDRFLYVNFDANSFFQAVHLCLVQHFYNNPCSSLCVDEKEFEHVLLTLDNRAQLCQSLRKLPTFGAQGQMSQRDVGKPNMSALIREKYTAVCSYQRCFSQMLRALHTLTKGLPCNEFASVRELYLAVLNKEPFFDSLFYKNSFSVLRNVASKELFSLIKSIIDVLKHRPNKALQVLVEQLTTLQRSLQLEQDLNMVAVGRPAVSTTSIEARPVKFDRKETLTSLRGKLNTAAKERREINLCTSEQEKILTVLDEAFRKFLAHPQTIPLNEVFYFQDISSVTNLIAVSPRCSIEFALERGSMMGHKSTQAFDTCIAYKLYLEHGRIIKLYDWFEAFSQIVEDENSTPATSAANKKIGSSKKRKMLVSPTKRTVKAKDHKDKEYLLFRFYRAIAELELVGYIKCNPTHPDRVTRLMWGSSQGSKEFIQHGRRSEADTNEQSVSRADSEQF